MCPRSIPLRNATKRRTTKRETLQQWKKKIVTNGDKDRGVEEEGGRDSASEERGKHWLLSFLLLLRPANELPDAVFCGRRAVGHWDQLCIKAASRELMQYSNNKTSKIGRAHV